jgi:hypothetical protein
LLKSGDAALVDDIRHGCTFGTGCCRHCWVLFGTSGALWFALLHEAGNCMITIATACRHGDI